MEEDLKHYLVGMEDRLTERIETTEAKMADMEQRLNERIDAKTEKVETALLTAFHKWASPMEARQRSHAAALRALDLELEAQGDRLKKLEGAA